MKVDKQSIGGINDDWEYVGINQPWDSRFGLVTVCSPLGGVDACVQGLQQGIYYRIRIRGENSAGFSSWAEESQAILVPGTAPTVTPTPRPGAGNTPTPIPTNVPRPDPTATPTITPTPRPPEVEGLAGAIHSIEMIEAQSQYRTGSENVNTLALELSISHPSLLQPNHDAFLGYKLAACRCYNAECYPVTTASIKVERDDEVCGIRLRGLGYQSTAKVVYEGNAWDRDDTPNVPNGGFAVSDAPIIYFWLITYWDTDPTLYPAITKSKAYSNVFAFANPLMEDKDIRDGYELLIPPYGEVTAEFKSIQGRQAVDALLKGVKVLNDNWTAEFEEFQLNLNEGAEHFTQHAGVNPNNATQRQAAFAFDIPTSELVKGKVSLRARMRIDAERYIPTNLDTLYKRFVGDDKEYFIPPFYPAYTQWTEPIAVNMDRISAPAPAPEFEDRPPDPFLVDAIIEIVNIIDPPPVGEDRNNQNQWIFFIAVFFSIGVGALTGTFARDMFISIIGGGFFFMLSLGWIAIFVFGVSPFIIAPILMAIVGGGIFLYFWASRF